MEVPLPFSSSSLCPHALPAAGSLSVASVGLVSHPVDPYVCFHLQLSVPMFTAVSSTFLLTGLWTPGAPEGCSLLLNLIRIPGAFPLPVGCQASRNIQETPPVPSPRQYTDSARIARGQGIRAPGHACTLGADPAWVSLPSSKKNSGAKGEPYLLLPEVVQFPHIEGHKYSFTFCPFHSNILR